MYAYWLCGHRLACIEYKILRQRLVSGFLSTSRDCRLNLRSAGSWITSHPSFVHLKRWSCRSPRSLQHEHVFELWSTVTVSGRLSRHAALTTPVSRTFRTKLIDARFS